MDLITKASSRDARELASIWRARLVPAVMVGSYFGVGIATFPLEAALYLHFLPLFAWTYWRLMLWKNHPATRVNTVAVPFSAALMAVAIAVADA